MQGEIVMSAQILEFSCTYFGTEDKKVLRCRFLRHLLILCNVGLY